MLVLVPSFTVRFGAVHVSLSLSRLGHLAGTPSVTDQCYTAADSTDSDSSNLMYCSRSPDSACLRLRPILIGPTFAFLLPHLELRSDPIFQHNTRESQ